MPEAQQVRGKVAIVTGGSTGIGKGTSRLLAEHGANLVIASRGIETLAPVAEEIEKEFGVRCVPVPTNVRKEEQIVALVQRTMEEFGRIDIVVNNAGGTRITPLSDITLDEWENVQALNLRGPFLLTREAGQHMIKQGSGSIVNISSGAGVYGVLGGAHYGAAKAGLQMLTRVTAAEWGQFGVRANCIAVGGIASERSIEGWKAGNIDPDDLANGVALKRIGWPIDIANVILFLGSDAASFLTGETILVDGGPRMPGTAFDH
jgi:citronellol/citronellal dehydrogenase